ncbi:MAG: hypothetical protein GWN46_14915, partial [Gammaproteobacteria bacterium]|nr:hypothetical protein [Gammaproteobacteria bacterium]
MARKTRIAILLGLFAAFAVSAGAQQTVGLFVNENPDPGYTLFSPIGSFTTYLINN